MANDLGEADRNSGWLVTGPPGIGKSMIINVLRSLAQVASEMEAMDQEAGGSTVAFRLSEVIGAADLSKDQNDLMTIEREGSQRGLRMMCFDELEADAGIMSEAISMFKAWSADPWGMWD
jgi:hypothetical protein